ncbi:Pls/PosA family non-ribosomal peptide synthetase [Actinomycetospora termitidis]|uniref:Phosphopantetheine-binding protein n=1 Tax=Actinomycetospora termitidis TaxID=3053470 RepID=A0ABT7MFX5_9PSEU|nr:Pls/PosA family non-ribosomal peptide synthetase [Actinomycetospora sp. Odt1-22]MDL5159570.1 phosphopantetheine-binding protein [Actinomycetospora sp. Odt1-22]
MTAATDAPEIAPLTDPAAVADAFAEVLAGVLKRDDVPVDEHFFEVLGADSMVMARFCARVRKRPGLPAVAMQDVYAHPTPAALALALTPSPEDAEDAAAEVASVPSSVADEAPAPDPGRPGSPALCGTLQAIVFLGYTYVAAEVISRGYDWLATTGGTGGGYLLDLYLRAVLLGAGGFAVLCVLPILLKWVLVGRWREQQVPVWTLRYVRFWTVKTLIRTNPLVFFVGSPLYVAYLRALGAKIGRGAVILSEHVPVCTDLLTVGAGTVVRKDVHLSCYHVSDRVIRTGRVTLGEDVYVGETTVLDIDTSMGDGASLGHTSSLHPGQVLLGGERAHGSPAQRTETDYRMVEPRRCGRVRRTAYTLVQLALTVFVALPVAVGALTLLLRLFPWAAALIDPPAGAIGTAWFHLETLALATTIVVGGTVLGVVGLALGARLLALPLRTGRTYPLYGVHYWLHRTISTITNVVAFTALFGDSSAIAHYLRAAGWRLRPMAQTGSNFGMAVRHESPFAAEVGRGTVVADGLSVISADYSSTSFRVTRARIGAYNFLGNRIAYPAQGRTGDNCLIATKCMVPVDGPVREGVGLLGSPSFEIPRTVARDTELAWGTPLDRRRSLATKNRHNTVSMLLHLAVRVGLTVGIGVLVAAMATVDIALGALEITIVEVAILLFVVGWNALVQLAVTRLQARAPEGLSIYDPRFWRHERFWKVPAPDFVQLFNGTPFKNVAWRLLGARVGPGVFDDGANLTEKSFTTIGARTTLNEGVVVQCHSQEDGAFKSDHVVFGDDVTLGVNAFLHYGTTIADGGSLAPDSFLMKGGEIPPGERWGGNPARPMTGTPGGHA